MSARHIYKPGLYFGLTFLITFAFWLPGAFLSHQETQSPLYILLGLAGMVTPFLLSLVLIFASNDPAMKKDAVNRLINPRLIQLRMLPAFLLIMPLTVAASILLSLPFGGSLTQFQLAEGFSFSAGAVPALLVLVLAACFEELGWRGYGFESLQSRSTYLTASLIFGLLWSLWHLPLVFVKGMYQYEIWQQNVWYGVNFFVSLIPLGVIVSWLCIKNGKSILAAVLFHFLVNIFQEKFSMTQTTKCIETLVLAVVAIAIVAFDKELFFSREHLAPSEGRWAPAKPSVSAS
ncbi:MAG TPA: MmRce1 family CPBP family CAAX prenyl protease [Chloroflexaceae bacterium]|nr:MmRce1 family CPBP family CAAX prenyl protease [Chloroflexaceae bacterium]